MKKKLIGTAFCMLLIMLVIPVGVSSENPDVDFKIYAGTEGRNIGTGIGFSVLNKGTEPVEVTLSLDQEYIFYQKDLTLSFTHLVRPNDDYKKVNFGIPGFGFKRIKTSIQLDDKIIIREGIAFCNLAILDRHIQYES